MKYAVALMLLLAYSANAENKCERQARKSKSIRNKSICSNGGLCMEVAENEAGYLYVYCYDENNEKVDDKIEWTVQNWVHSPRFLSGGNGGNCMGFDWGDVEGYTEATVICIAKNHPKGWQQVQGKVVGQSTGKEFV